MQDVARTAKPPQWPNAQPNDGRHVSWIAGRVTTLLSHYFQPDQPSEVTEAAMDDWISALVPFSRGSIETACQTYLRDQPRRRPTPGDIRSRATKGRTEATGRLQDRGERSTLSFDEMQLLETKVLPTARRWLGIPSLAEHGRKTLAYWGEAIP